ncbi:MAG: histidine phosphatase family protein [Gammaproteobacteria bacterium]
MTELLIARHGNTFTSEQTPLRIGRRSDTPLVSKGQQQAQALGRYLKQQPIPLAAVYSSNLSRTYDTAMIALQAANINLPITQMDQFDEIDYGVDEAKTEAQVSARLGEAALAAWDKEAIVPPGWLIDPEQIIQSWHVFAQMIHEKYEGKTVLVVTSNGIARFAPHITGNFDSFKQKHSIKLTTGALASFIKTDDRWQINYWNLKP